MTINRRSFFKVLGLTGLSIGTGHRADAAENQEGETEFYSILYDSTRCGGCQVCEIVCAEEHGLPEADMNDIPEVGKKRRTNENRRSVINAFQTSLGELYVKNQCMQCNQPACASACLTKAMHKTGAGPVIWRGDKCMGCRYCMISCPYDMPKFEFDSTNPKIEKCTMCYQRIQEGNLPVCVENCPAEALVFGTRKDMINDQIPD